MLRESDLRSYNIAFPTEMEIETKQEQDTLDDPDEEADEEDEEAPAAGSNAPLDAQDDEANDAKAVGPSQDAQAEEESEFLDSLQMVGFPKDEQARRKAWMELPHDTRAAIRRLYHISGHKPVSVMLHLLRGARASPELIKALKNFRCDVCTELQKGANVVKFKMPSTCAFNDCVGLDVFYLKDSEGITCGFLSIVCSGTTFHAAPLVCAGHGNPLSSKCLSKFQSH